MQKPEEVRMVKRLHIGNKWMLGEIIQIEPLSLTGKKVLVIVKYRECNYNRFVVRYVN
jgi:hypothetical protein